jgi:hypothetical protein
LTKPICLVLDDEAITSSQWADQLQSLTTAAEAFDIQALSVDEIRSIAAELENRRRAARGAGYEMVGTPLDSAALVFIDFDLLFVDDNLALNGEELSYLARTYSACGYIVSLNQFGRNSFDLTLRDHLSSYADLNLGSDQIANPGLWSEPWSGFRPWSWPLLPRAVEAAERRVADLSARLDEPILDFLGLSMKRLPRDATEFLSAARTSETVTFRSFAHDSGNGLRPRDVCGDESLIRLVQSRIAKWLECDVLAGQDVLVDAPHLVQRYPRLLPGGPERPEEWDSAVALSNEPQLMPAIEPHRFANSHWLSRAAWRGDALGSDENIPDVRDPWSAPQVDLVFAEDLSRFLPYAAVREFSAAVSSPFTRRFVLDARSVAGADWAGAVKGVSYRPADRYSL